MKKTDKQKFNYNYLIEFLRSNKNCHVLVNSHHEDVIRWAIGKTFINARSYMHIEYYTDSDLDAALMWKEKDNNNLLD